MTTYTASQREHACALYLEVGAAEAARRMNVSSRSIRRWASEAGLSAARDEKLEDGAARLHAQHGRLREELRVRLLESALDMLDRLTEPHKDYKGSDVVEVTWDMAPADACRAYMTAVGIAIDKYRLEMGEATERILTLDVISEEISRLESELDRRPARTPAPTP